MNKKKIAVTLLKVARSLLALDVGKTFENDNIRVHRYRPNVHVWDLTNAGRRGKKVEHFYVGWPPATDEHAGDELCGLLVQARDYEAAKKTAKDFVAEHTGYDMEEYSARGVDVTPPGFKPISITNDHVSVDADYDSFAVQNLYDQNNLPTCIPAVRGGKKDIMVFYRLVSDHEAEISRMNYRQVLDMMDKAGIDYHTYCAMD